MSDELDIDYSTPAVLPDDPEAARARVDWHARMVRYWTAIKTEEIESYKREIERLKAAIAERESTAQNRIDWHTAPIESYHRMRQAEDPELRTLRTPHAASKITVPTKPQVQFVEYSDDGDGYDEPLLRYLTELYPHLLKLPGISEFRKLVEVDEDGHVVDRQTGRIVEGLRAEVPAPTYKLTPEPGEPLA